MQLTSRRAVTVVAAVTMSWISGCSTEEATLPASTAPGDSGVQVVLAADIPVAHTPPGGYGATFPEPILGSCTEPLVEGAPDMRGIWQTVAAERNGEPVPGDDRVWDHFQRIEQCGDRVTITAGGIIHDMRADGTELNGVHDVAEFDLTTPLTVVATFEDGVHVLRPVGVPVEVTRQLDGDTLIWTYLGTTVVLERIGDPGSPPPTT